MSMDDSWKPGKQVENKQELNLMGMKKWWSMCQTD